MDPSVRCRLLVCLVIGIANGLLTHVVLVHRGPMAFGFDFTYPWLAAKAILHGTDPYAFVRSQPTPFAPSLFYPLPAGLVVIPLAGLPVRAAASLFIGIGCSTLAFVTTSRDIWRAVLFLSAPAAAVVLSVQWSPLLMAGALWPGLIWIAVVKPNFAFPVLMYQTSRRSLVAFGIGVGIILVISLAIEPAWPGHWIDTIRSSPASGQYRVPILSKWGAPLALSALAIRHRDGRLLLAMSCVPQNFFLYDQLILFLIPESRIELMAMAAVSWFAHPILWIGTHHWVPPQQTALLSTLLEPSVIVSLYYPALVIVALRFVKSRQCPHSARLHTTLQSHGRAEREDVKR